MLKIIYEDIKNKKHLDIYIVLFLMAAIYILDWIFSWDFESSKLLAPILLVFCSILLFISSKLESITNPFDDSTPHTVNHDFPPNYHKVLADCNHMDISGIHHSTLFNDYSDAIESILKKGGKLRVLMIPENSEAVLMTCTRFYNEVTPPHENERIKSCKDFLIKKAKEYPKQIELYEKDYLFGRAVTLIDSDKKYGKIIEQRYTYKFSGGASKPKFFYDPSNEWYAYLVKEFEKHIEDAKKLL